MIPLTFSGIYAAIGAFLLFSMIQFRDGPFIRPHPAFWRIVLGINLIYELAMVFLLFQDLNTARDYMVLLDSNLGVPLPEKSYGDDCSLSWKTIWVWCLPSWSVQILTWFLGRSGYFCKFLYLPVHGHLLIVRSALPIHSGGLGRPSFSGITGSVGYVEIK